ncbi:hypothetical protein BDW59DRAFT_165759 [Aspergillus cavernicola]|uniref:Hexokinase N-terminal domain-containing protein n=1 Tax=Aspergillus cavernicola TaxID=176166 RepID=A0ABR4HR29_9EURO
MASSLVMVVVILCERILLIPADIRKKLDAVKQMLTVDSATLKRITDHFVRQLEHGLAEHDSEIPMNITWAMHLPTGQEKQVDTSSSFKLLANLHIGTGEQLDKLYEILDQHEVLPRVPVDLEIDQDFAHPGQQTYER